MKRKIIGFFIVAAFFISSAAFAQRPGQQSLRRQNEFRTQNDGMRLNRMQQPRVQRDTLLTDEQRDAIQNIRLESQDELLSLQNQLRELEAHQQTLTSEEAGLNEINKNIDEIFEVRAKIEKVRVKQQKDIRALLTEEQLLRLDRMRSLFGAGENGNFRDNRMRRNGRS